jgi:flagellar export protein FliJ
VKRYKFRLAAVQRVRSIELDRAVGEVARARLELAAAHTRTEALEASYRRLPAGPDGSTPADLRNHHERLRLAADAIVAARQAAVAQQQVVEVRMAEWADADRKVRLLDQLDERSRARHTAEALLEEQQVLDDIVTSRQGRAA